MTVLWKFWSKKKGTNPKSHGPNDVGKAAKAGKCEEEDLNMCLCSPVFQLGVGIHVSWRSIWTSNVLFRGLLRFVSVYYEKDNHKR